MGIIGKSNSYIVEYRTEIKSQSVPLIRINENIDEPIIADSSSCFVILIFIFMLFIVDLFS